MWPRSVYTGRTGRPTQRTAANPSPTSRAFHNNHNASQSQPKRASAEGASQKQRRHEERNLVNPERENLVSEEP